MLQKAKFSFQPAVIRGAHVSDYNPRFGNSKNPTQNVKIKTCLLDVTGYTKKCKYYCYHFSVSLLWEMALLHVSENIHLLSKYCTGKSASDCVISIHCNRNIFVKKYEFYPSSENNYMTKRCHFAGMMFLSNF